MNPTSQAALRARHLVGVAILFVLGSCVKRKLPAPGVAIGPAEPMYPVPAVAVATEDDAAAAAAWTVEVAEGGTLRVNFRGAQVLSFHYLFWGPNFSWANPVVTNVKTTGGVTTFDLVVDALGLKIAGKMAKSGPGEMSIEFGVVAEKQVSDVTGGGLEFNLNLDAAVPGKGNAPSLLLDRRGFKWEAAAADAAAKSNPSGYSTPSGVPQRLAAAPAEDAITVVFDPPLPATFFEREQRNTVRCFLVGKDIEPGVRQVAMKLRLPQGGAVRKSVDERYGHDDRSAWYADALPWDAWPIDVSFLNERPAGKHGRVRAEGDRLVFEDGTPARFWGTNLLAHAIFNGKKEDIAHQAKRIAALGYNLVRIHHHDSPSVSPNVFDKSAGTTQKLDDAALDVLDWWVKCLKDEGVYVWLDLHVGRQFQKGDNIEGFAELAKQQGSGKGFNYVNPRIEKLMQRFADQYVTRTNRYTGKPYAEEPALAFVLITNENDLTFHFANLFLADRGNPVHRRLFDALAKEVAKRAGIPASASLKVWEPGSAKIVLNDIEHLYDARAIGQLRSDGVKALVATTSFWGAQSLYSLPSLATGDIVDVHSYGKSESLGTNPRFEANFVSWIGAAQIAGRPLSISEWNVEYPNRDRLIAPLYVSAIAALQGWDAPMIYGYCQIPIAEPDSPDTYSSWNDPGLTALMPAAALMFRQGHVKEAQKTYRLDLSRESLYYANTSPDTSVAIRTLVEQSKLTIGLPEVPELGWDDSLSAKVPGAVAFSDLARDFVPEGQNFVASDTGELKRDWSLGVETIDTPLSQAAFGWIGGRSIALHDVALEIETQKAAVAVTSLDDRPIATSKKMLVTLVAQVAASPGDKLPFLSQPVQGTIALRASQPLRLVPLSPRANATPGTSVEKAGTSVETTTPGSPPRGMMPIMPLRKGDAQLFTVGRAARTHWFLLVP